jgi:membrane protein DedA with SNARE-associated domain
VLFNAIGAAAWVGVWSTAGYVAGDHWEVIGEVVHRYEPYAIAALVLAVLAVVALRLRRRRRRA